MSLANFFRRCFLLSAIAWIVTVIHIICAISIIIIVLLQSGKAAGMGAIAGGAETFFGKNKGRTIDALLGKYTAVAAITFLITSLLLYALIDKII
jgi:preprotein translocase subunit SecG